MCSSEFTAEMEETRYRMGRCLGNNYSLCVKVFCNNTEGQQSPFYNLGNLSARAEMCEKMQKLNS